VNLADDGFGNLISTRPAPSGFTWVFFRWGNRLQRWHVGTPDHARAIEAVAHEVKESIRPILALIEGGKKGALA
jgi:hypothetical protein